jgi:predicted AlkP superfamily pyrophosphatase or phosphodiesterase
MAGAEDGSMRLGGLGAAIIAAVLGVARASAMAADGPPAPAPAARNIVIFVADGLRPGSVNLQDAPALSALREQGVSFANSHSLFPTFTTPNASAIATGHYLGDTGDFGNALYTGYRLFDSGNFAHPAASSIPFIENDAVLGDLDDHFEGNYLGEDTLLALARAHGYSTAAIGKLGPVAIQDITQLMPQQRHFTVPQTIIIDDATGADAPPLADDTLAALARAGLPNATPARQQGAGDRNTAGTHDANLVQQRYFIDAATRAVLPLLRQRGRPFVLLYWSRDPDGTQHNQGDSFNSQAPGNNSLAPGINGATSKAAVHDADDNLQQILDYLHADPALAASTDVIVTSDHGFATISKHDVDAAHHATASFSAAASYDDVPPGFLPPGFLAIDLAHALDLPLYDPARIVTGADGQPAFERVAAGAHPMAGHGLIGGSGRATDRTDAAVVVAANGGSDLIYLPHGDAALARRLLTYLASQDYVGALFADEGYGRLAGALPLSDIALVGSSRLPRPAIVVSFKTFTLDAAEAASADPLQNAVQIADTTLQQGQGMHGSFGRDNTFNFMAAIGPDFKTRYRDPLPASNADITPTLLQLLGWQSRAHGALVGRVLEEAVDGGRDAHGGRGARGDVSRCLAVSTPAADGRRTALEYQVYRGRVYPDTATLRVVLQQERTGCHRG